MGLNNPHIELISSCKQNIFLKVLAVDFNRWRKLKYQKERITDLVIREGAVEGGVGVVMERWRNEGVAGSPSSPPTAQSQSDEGTVWFIGRDDNRRARAHYRTQDRCRRRPGKKKSVEIPSTSCSHEAE